MAKLRKTGTDLFDYSQLKDYLTLADWYFESNLVAGKKNDKFMGTNKH